MSYEDDKVISSIAKGLPGSLPGTLYIDGEGICRVRYTLTLTIDSRSLNKLVEWINEATERRHAFEDEKARKA